ATVPRFATGASPARAFAAYIRDRVAAGQRVVVAAIAERDSRVLARRAEQAVGRPPERVADWDAVTAAPAGALLALQLDLDAGFVDGASGTTVVAAADLLGSRAMRAADREATSELPIGEIEFRLGDAVIHIDHGMGALRGLETVSVAETAADDTIRLEYAGASILMAPVEEIGKVWRYGSDAEAVSLDRLDSDTWATRRAKAEAELAETARRLIDLARARQAVSAPKLVPPRDYERFAARFPYSETPDQARAMEETLADIASGRPMDRLVCGDVGFGKTEVALRAAAAAALAGKQVAVVAPTTVLVRQHMQTFRRRFAGLGVEVAHLSRLVKPAEARAVKQGLADGSVRVVVGTHALAAKGVRFKDLGLMIIDEEQRFGARHKAKLRDLGRGVHVLTLTATPIPRTLQSAMIGLQDLSIMATPPARRQPIRTFLTPFDPVTAREALLRERRRGGQSFVVCPRIEDIEPMAARLRELVPELHVMVAHGKMPAEEIDDTMVRFADGEGDTLLATNIIESGLDVPRANTILIWRADRFGLSQLHQLRGRVGRGRLRGVAYLLTDPAAKIGAATEKRLRTLEALDRLGAGFAISARDLDLRGAGDLLGEEQAGHVKLIGVGLYQHFLERALRVARGEAPGDDWSPELNLGLTGLIPEDYVPEAEVRINLYARLARLQRSGEIDAFGDEIEDRFGPMPEAVR
ncbi:MAG: DEAD/DEAH box helicase, partial [Pseudomonadota bacterium]|nr:DEAD/DEAH box helicase [Pseudomonadota bacterium]